MIASCQHRLERAAGRRGQGTVTGSGPRRRVLDEGRGTGAAYQRQTDADETQPDAEDDSNNDIRLSLHRV